MDYIYFFKIISMVNVLTACDGLNIINEGNE
jgi:hypothetical protein